jgi:predicted transcriptional regulator
VTGIVGTVNAGQSQINIQHLSGAAVRKISVDSRTSIRKAGGDSLTLGEIRPSDRIIAEGTLNDRQDTLLATLITVEQVVPGAQPGG